MEHEPLSPGRGGPDRAGRSLASTLLLNASLLVLVIVLFMAWRWSTSRDKPSDTPARDQTSRPARPASLARAGAETQPADDPPAGATTQPGGEGNLSPFAVDLTPTERIAMGAVRDFIHRLDETGLYVLLGHAAKRDRLSADEIEALPRADLAEILKRPALYRAQPMRLRVRAFFLRESRAGRELSARRQWPKGSVAWRIDALDVVAYEKTPHPVVVYLTEDPTDAIGKPDKVRTSGDQLFFEPGRRLELVGMFYKVFTDKEEGSDNLRDYPVFVAWQVVGKADKKDKGFNATQMMTLFIGILLVMLLAFVMLKKQLRQMKKDSPIQPRRYKPLRDMSAENDQAAGAALKLAAPPEEDADAGEIDPLLKQASEEYLRKKEQEGRHGTDGTS